MSAAARAQGTAREQTSITAPSVKFHVPVARRESISRRRLISEARRDGEVRIVSVGAPAGYGKSTLLAEWARLDDREVVWVSLDQFDDDPAALLGLLASAFERLAPDDARLAEVGAMPKSGAAALGRAAPVLASALEQIGRPFLLVLDDVHEVAAPGCQDVLEVVLSRLPAGSQAVIAGRQEAPFVGRLRARGGVRDVTAVELAIDEDGARRIFASLHVKVPASAELHHVVERTEGWVTGIVLAALIARAGGDPDALTGDDRYVADYLYRACYAGLSDEDREFLRRSAILEQLSADSCDAVLDIADSRARLAGLEARSLFLVPLDDAHKWYRYHSLFREFLLGELHRSDASVIEELHARAAAWCESRGLMEQTIEHLLAAGDRQRTPRLVAEHTLSVYRTGELALVTRWMSVLGEATIRSYPPLAVLAGTRAALVGEPRVADQWAEVLDELEYDAPAELGLPTFASARAMLRVAMWRHGLAAAVEDAAFALDREPETSPWRDQALHRSAWTKLLGGDVDAARAAFEESSRIASRLGNTDSILLSEAELASIALDHGAVVEAAAHADRAMRAVEQGRMRGYAAAVLPMAVAARVDLARGDTDRAERKLAHAMRDRGLCTYAMPVFSVRAHLELARAHLTAGRQSATAHLLGEIDDILSRRPGLGTLIGEVAAVRAAMGLSRAVDGSPLTPAELRLLPYLQTHLTIGEIGARLFISRNTVSSQLGSIYRKLQVTNRAAAVERSMELGILGELSA